jgi:hypothetical protein
MIPPGGNDQDPNLDRLLNSYLGPAANTLNPSSGFTQSVMDAVREQSTAPEPIPFPWKRFLPFVLALLSFLVIALLHFALAEPSSPLSYKIVASSLLPSPRIAVTIGSIVTASGLCLITTILSIRLAKGRE